LQDYRTRRVSNWLTVPLFLAEVGPAGRAPEAAQQAMTSGVVRVEMETGSCPTSTAA